MCKYEWNFEIKILRLQIDILNIKDELKLSDGESELSTTFLIFEKCGSCKDFITSWVLEVEGIECCLG